MSVRIRRDTEIRKRDPLRSMLSPSFSTWSGGEIEQDGRLLVGARGVFIHHGEDLGRLALRGREGVVDGLEDPGEAVDAEIEEDAPREVEVHHAVFGAVGAPGVLDVLAEAGVGDDAVDGPQVAVGDHFADLDA